MKIIRSSGYKSKVEIKSDFITTNSNPCMDCEDFSMACFP
jgi:hypothetical protein